MGFTAKQQHTATDVKCSQARSQKLRGTSRANKHLGNQYLYYPPALITPYLTVPYLPASRSTSNPRSFLQLWKPVWAKKLPLPFLFEVEISLGGSSTCFQYASRRQLVDLTLSLSTRKEPPTTSHLSTFPTGDTCTSEQEGKARPPSGTPITMHPPRGAVKMEASLPSSSKATKKGGCQSSDPPLNDAGYEPDGDDSPNEDTEVEVIVNDSDLNMPSNRQRPPPRREADMSSIINTAQRAELSTLIEAIMEKISTQVQKPFTFLSHPAAQKNRVQVWNYAPVMEAAVASVDPAAGPPTNGVVVYGYCKPSMSVQELDDAGVSPDSGETEATPDPEKVQGQDAGDADDGADDDDGKAPFVIIPEIGANSVEATVPSMSELQKDVSSYFGKWKAAFQKRFNDFVVPKFANSSAGPPGQGQGPPRGGAVGAGASGRTQQPQQGKLIDPARRWSMTGGPPVRTNRVMSFQRRK